MEKKPHVSDDSPLDPSNGIERLYDGHKLVARCKPRADEVYPHDAESSWTAFPQIPHTSDGVRFLRLPEVRAITGLSKTSLYELIRERSFPPPVRLGARSVAWVWSEVNQWAASRIEASRSIPALVQRKTRPHPVRPAVDRVIRKSA